MAITLYAAGSSANHTYVPRSTGASKVEMVESTVGTLSDPLILTQQLTIRGPSARGNQRYFVSIRRNVTDVATGIPETGSISAQVSIPKTSAWTDTYTKDLLSEMASVLGACKAYGAGGTIVSGCTDTTGYPAMIAKLLFVGL